MKLKKPQLLKRGNSDISLQVQRVKKNRIARVLTREFLKFVCLGSDARGRFHLKKISDEEKDALRLIKLGYFVEI